MTDDLTKLDSISGLVNERVADRPDRDIGPTFPDTEAARDDPEQHQR